MQEALQNQKPLSYLVGSYVFLDAKQRPIDQELFRQKGWEHMLKRLGRDPDGNNRDFGYSNENKIIQPNEIIKTEGNIIVDAPGVWSFLCTG